MESGKLGMKNQSFSIFHFQLSIIKTPPTHCDEGIFFNVDQQGLEPRTNRLWAGCSNQLSYWSILNWPPICSTVNRGSPNWARTSDTRINSPLLYLLSYGGSYNFPTLSGLVFSQSAQFALSDLFPHTLGNSVYLCTLALPAELWRIIHVGSFLFFRAVTSQVSSAPLSLTSVFGMGTGVPSTSSTPTILYSFSLYTSKNDSWGNRTPVTGVRGRCLNRLTNEPYRTRRSFLTSESFGTPSGTRTLDTLIKSQVLYQLS